MFARLLLLFILLPLADLVLIWMLLKLDVGLTVLWIVVSGLIGAWYVRRQGIQVMDELRKTLAQNQLPTHLIAEGAIVLFAGGLLITPGLLTDLLGFSMLIKPSRRWYGRRLMAWLKSKVKISTSGFTMGGMPGDDVLDAEVLHRKNRPGEPIILEPGILPGPEERSS